MIELLVISVYLILLLVLGIFASRMFRGTSEDYMLASHSIGPFLLLMSLFGTTMTAFALVGSTGEAFTEGVGVYGMLASSSGIIHSLCFFVLGVKLWEFGKKYGYRTQIQFFRDRLESDKIGVLLFPILVGLVIPYLLIGVISSGIVISSVSEGAFQNSFAQYDYGVPPWLGSLVVSIVVLIYVFFGGMRGTAWANAFQTMVFMVLGVVTFYLIADKLGGAEHASQLVKEKHPSKLMRGVDPQDAESFEKQWNSWTTLAQYNMVTDNGKQPILEPAQIEQAQTEYKGPKIPNWQKRAQAAFAARQGLLDLEPGEFNLALLKQDGRGTLESLPAPWNEVKLDPETIEEFPRIEGIDARIGDSIFADKIGHPNQPLDPSDPEGEKKWTLKKARGVYRASNWSPEPPQSTSKLLFFTYMLIPFSVGMFPHLFQHWLTARSANSFKLPVVAHPIFIMIVWVPCVLVGVWATSAELNGSAIFPPHFPPNAVLPALVKRLTGSFLTGLLTAGVLAAIMSSLDSQFLCIGTMFTEDIATHYGGKDRFTDRQVLLMARGFIIAIVALTYLFSLAEPRRVFTLGVWTFSGFSSLFPLVFASLYWRRLTKAGAYASVLVTAITWLYFFSASGYAANAEYYVFGMMPVVPMFAASAVALVLVSLVTSPPSEATLDRFFPKRSVS